MSRKKDVVIGGDDDIDDVNYTSYVSSIETSCQPLDISFHPTRSNLIATALVDGSLEVHDINDVEDEGDEYDSLLSSLSLHASLSSSSSTNNKHDQKGSSRCVAFSLDGTEIYTGGSYGDLCSVDAERACTFSTSNINNHQPLWRVRSATISKMKGSNPNSNNNNNSNSNKTNGHNPLVVMYPFRKDGDSGTSLLATGDDNGGIRIWDERLLDGGGGGGGNRNSNKRPKGCVLEWNQHDDYVSGIEYSAHGTGNGNNTLLATSADGSLGVYDLRMNKGTVIDTTRKSDHQDDELLSLCILKSGGKKKVVCGTQTGTLSVFSWGTWGDISDRFPGHPSSVDALLKVDENTVLTGSSDGLIRVVQLHPDKFLGILNESADARMSSKSGPELAGNDQDNSHGHGGYPVEKLEYNSNKDVVGSVSHDNYVRLWDARILKDDNNDDDDDDDDDEEELSEEKDDTKASVASKITIVSTAMKNYNINKSYNSDDQWEDMDNQNDDDDSEDDSDDSSPEPDTVNNRRQKKLKTENDKFFDDL